MNAPKPDPHEDPQLETISREVGREIAAIVDSAGALVGRKIGFSLILFDFGDAGFLSYLSNASREDMIHAIDELLGRLRAGCQ